METRPIPSSGEELPVVGLGTWQKFDVPQDPALTKPLRSVLKRLTASGGSVIDTSPMYGQAESVLGTLVEEMDLRDDVFLATKVWTRGRRNGIQQMEKSLQKLKVSTVDLMQVHNLVDWETHIETLRDWKDQGQIRYLGVTHYTRSAFNDLAHVIRNEPLDFVQLPYSLGFRDAENRLLPLAQEQDVGVIVNRPFEAGRLFRMVEEESIPEWSRQFGVETWAQFFLKYILGHSAVTCVIPGTNNPDHMLENARAGTGSFPGKTLRQKMVKFWESRT
jgi:diketogulonate reductase-like aldo/keto reductase